MRFEDLEAWQEARILVRHIYSLTSIGKLSRNFGLCDQIQRASTSTMSNVAEGFERFHLQEKIHFYNIARASTGEVRSQLYVIEDNFPVDPEKTEQLRNHAIHIGKLITGLIKSTEDRK